MLVRSEKRVGDYTTLLWLQIFFRRQVSLVVDRFLDLVDLDGVLNAL